MFSWQSKHFPFFVQFTCKPISTQPFCMYVASLNYHGETISSVFPPNVCALTSMFIRFVIEVYS
jgi:hypothetical protein